MVFEEQSLTDWEDEIDSSIDENESESSENCSAGTGGSEADCETISASEGYTQNMDNYELHSVIKIEPSTDHYFDPENIQIYQNVPDTEPSMHSNPDEPLTLAGLDRNPDFIECPQKSSEYVERYHLMIDEQQFGICTKGFFEQHDIMRHLKAEHSPNHLYHCSLCIKKFVRQSDLAKHLRTHADKKPFSCEFCNKKFLLACNLEMHLQTHVPHVL